MGALKVAVLVLFLSVIVALLIGREELLGAVLPPCLIRIMRKYVPTSLMSSSGAVPSQIDELQPLTPAVINGRIYTKEELALYDGSPGSPGILIGIMGQVFDVEKGKQHYGPGGGYSFFAAIDGSRAFVTGEFNEAGLIDNLDGITSQQASELSDWVDFYHKDYTPVGVVIGEFYDNEGKHTAALVQFAKLVREAKQIKANKEADEKRFPACNSQWTKEDGTTVWCSDKSGGVERDWAGVPRKYRAPGGTSTRCACIKTTGPATHQSGEDTNRGDLDSPHFKPYKGCDLLSASCKVIKEK